MAAKRRYPVVCQEWEESERGWGCRPDGATLHLTQADREQFEKDYWAKMPKDQVPDEYSRPCGSPTVIDVDASVYKRIRESKNGIWLWQLDYSKIREMKK